MHIDSSWICDIRASEAIFDFVNTYPDMIAEYNTAREEKGFSMAEFVYHCKPYTFTNWFMENGLCTDVIQEHYLF